MTLPRARAVPDQGAGASRGAAGHAMNLWRAEPHVPGDVASRYGGPSPLCRGTWRDATAGRAPWGVRVGRGELPDGGL
jgi:hypothetical protein